MVCRGEDVVLVVAMDVTKDQREKQMSHLSYRTSGGVISFPSHSNYIRGKKIILPVCKRFFCVRKLTCVSVFERFFV